MADSNSSELCSHLSLLSVAPAPMSVPLFVRLFFCVVLSTQLYTPCEQIVHLLFLITVSLDQSIVSEGSINVCLKEEEEMEGIKKHFCVHIVWHLLS